MFRDWQWHNSKPIKLFFVPETILGTYRVKLGSMRIWIQGVQHSIKHRYGHNAEQGPPKEGNSSQSGQHDEHTLLLNLNKRFSDDINIQCTALKKLYHNVYLFILLLIKQINEKYKYCNKIQQIGHNGLLLKYVYQTIYYIVLPAVWLPCDIVRNI